MPAHKWKILKLSGKVMQALGWIGYYRQCEHCLRAQNQQPRTEWGYIRGYYWTPKVGRCPGEHDPNDLGVRIIAAQSPD